MPSSQPLSPSDLHEEKPRPTASVVAASDAPSFIPSIVHSSYHHNPQLQFMPCATTATSPNTSLRPSSAYSSSQNENAMRWQKETFHTVEDPTIQRRKTFVPHIHALQALTQELAWIRQWWTKVFTLVSSVKDGTVIHHHQHHYSTTRATTSMASTPFTSLS
jgi:hypothetical protein